MSVKCRSIIVFALLFAHNLAWAVSFDVALTYPQGLSGNITATVKLDCNTGLPLTQSHTASENIPVIFSVDSLVNFSDVLCVITISNGPIGYSFNAIANTHSLNGPCIYTFSDDLFDSVALETEGSNTCLFQFQE